MKTIFSVFRSYQEASDAVAELIDAGQPADQVNVIIEQAVAKNAIADLDFNRATV